MAHIHHDGDVDSSDEFKRRRRHSSGGLVVGGMFVQAYGSGL